MGEHQPRRGSVMLFMVLVAAITVAVAAVVIR